jgi:transposase
MYTEAYVKQLEEKIESLQQENKNLHESVEYLTHKLFGSSSEKTSAILGQVSLFNEAENEANSKAPEPTLEDIKGYMRKKFPGQREELLKN